MEYDDEYIDSVIPPPPAQPPPVELPELDKSPQDDDDEDYGEEVARDLSSALSQIDIWKQPSKKEKTNSWLFSRRRRKPFPNRVLKDLGFRKIYFKRESLVALTRVLEICTDRLNKSFDDSQGDWIQAIGRVLDFENDDQLKLGDGMIDYLMSMKEPNEYFYSSSDFPIRHEEIETRRQFGRLLEYLSKEIISACILVALNEHGQVNEAIPLLIVRLGILNDAALTQFLCSDDEIPQFMCIPPFKSLNQIKDSNNNNTKEDKNMIVEEQIRKGGAHYADWKRLLEFHRLIPTPEQLGGDLFQSNHYISKRLSLQPVWGPWKPVDDISLALFERGIGFSLPIWLKNLYQVSNGLNLPKYDILVYPIQMVYLEFFTSFDMYQLYRDLNGLPIVPLFNTVKKNWNILVCRQDISPIQPFSLQNNNKKKKEKKRRKSSVQSMLSTVPKKFRIRRRSNVPHTFMTKNKMLDENDIIIKDDEHVRFSDEANDNDAEDEEEHDKDTNDDSGDEYDYFFHGDEDFAEDRFLGIEQQQNEKQTTDSKSKLYWLQKRVLPCVYLCDKKEKPIKNTKKQKDRKSRATSRSSSIASSSSSVENQNNKSRRRASSAASMLSRRTRRCSSAVSAGGPMNNTYVGSIPPLQVVLKPEPKHRIPARYIPVELHPVKAAQKYLSMLTGVETAGWNVEEDEDEELVTCCFLTDNQCSKIDKIFQENVGSKKLGVKKKKMNNI